MKKLLLLLSGVLLLLPVSGQQNDHHFDVAKNLDVLNAIYKQLDLLYVDTIHADEVVQTGINAMLRSLDPYTVYYPEEKQKDLNYMLTGTYAGIGAIIRYNLSIGRVIIEEPYEGMPAAEVGLKRGDIILAIDDEDMTNKAQDYVSEHLRGEAGTSFILKVKRPSTGKTLKKKITRRPIQTPSVPFYSLRDNGVGYISLTSFTEGCSKDFRRALLDLKRQGMTSLVFDLRNNGGGSEAEAVQIVNMFVPKGQLIVSNRGKVKQVNRDYRTTVEPIDSVMPLVVLVNGSSASASEIVSGALQDLDRAVIVGTRTFGKGLVQITTDLPYNGTLKLTSNKYFIPSGRCIQAVNYRHSRGGYVEHVPDSLTKVFHTANGREVRDGGGIHPDVEVKPDSASNLTYSLAALRDSDELLLNYELDYVAKHPTIAPAAEFEITDADFDEFKARVLKSRFQYDRVTEKYVEELEKIAKLEGYYDGARQEFDALRTKLHHDTAKDLDFNRQALKELISNNIVTCYYFQRGNIEHALRYDKQMKEAERLLGNLEEYRRLLTP